MIYSKSLICKKLAVASIASLMIVNTAFASENKVYAVVNGDNITAQSIAVALKDPSVKFDALPKETQMNILSRIVEQKILAQNAMKTDAINNPIYKQTLKSIKQDLALQVWMQDQSLKINVSNSELKDFYKSNSNLFKMPAQYHARHILVKTENEAKEIIKTLNKSTSTKSKFISLAKEKSTGPSGKSGGDLGFFTTDKMVPEFSKATETLKVGKVTQSPVKTQFGFHVIFLEDKKNATTVKFETAKEKIKQQLTQNKLMEKIQKIADELKKKSKIEYK